MIQKFKIILGVTFLSFFIFVLDVQAVTVSPLRQAIVIEPGEQTTVLMRVKNDSDEKKNFGLSVDSFDIDEGTGAAVFGSRDESIAWVKPKNKFINLDAGEELEIEFLVNVPVGAHVRSRYLGLFVGSAAEGGGNVSVQSRVGSLLFLHMTGSLSEEMSQQIFTTNKRFYFQNPIEVFVQLRNDGTLHTVPTGKIELVDRGGSVISTLSFNKKNKKVLPNTNWKQDYVFDSLSWRNIGPVEVRMDVLYGVTGQTFSSILVIWFLPWQFLAILLGVVVVYLWLMIHMKKRFKSRSL